NKRFVEAVNKEFGADPGYYTLGAYSAGVLIEQAVRAVKGKVEDKDAFMKALKNPGTVHDARGDWKLDEYGNPVMPIYIRNVEQRTVSRINLPGFGASNPIELHSVADHADHVSRVMDALNLPTDTAVFGNGFGAFVALELAIRHGKRFGPLIVADTLASFPEP